MTLAAARPCGLVLAATAGRRGATDFALLRAGQKTLIEEHVAGLRRAGIVDIAVVRHADAQDLPSGVGNVRVVLEPPDATPFESLVMGLFALNRTPVLVLPVETDLIGDDTYDVLAEEAMDEAATHAVVPRFNEEWGYPIVLFKGGVDAVVRDASDPHGSHLLERLLTRWAHGVRPLDVADDAVARTFELPREFARLGLRE